MVARFRVFSVGNDLVFERSVEVDSRISPGVFEFTVGKPWNRLEELASLRTVAEEVFGGLDVIGLAYGEPKTYLGTFEDVETGERYSGFLATLPDESLKVLALRVGSVELESSSVYAIRREVRSDVMFSEELTPGTRVAFRGFVLV
ncbi:hypothetical protein [Thermococcus sp.]|uniref:hypothetical protein n=1 Tax=Thermococcus sp. TaxID=35749 RepID=UPI00260B58C1|nr:hypothetical protein [Thermococcus sp.]